MMPPIRFTVHGIPKGQPRPKAFARKFGTGAGAHYQARVYDPGTAEAWKGQVAIAAKDFIPAEPLQMALYLRIEFYFPRPRSHYRTGKFSHLLRDDVPEYCESKPDFDNLAKAVSDALTILRMWRDDAQVVDCRIVKHYDQGAGPGCSIEIKEA